MILVMFVLILVRKGPINRTFMPDVYVCFAVYRLFEEYMYNHTTERVEMQHR